MDQPILVERELVLGREALDALAQAGFAPDLVAWVLDDDADEWRLLVADRTVADSGPTASYKRAFAAIGETEVQLPLTQLWLVDPDDLGVAGLRRFMEATSEDAVRPGGGVAVAGRSVSEVFIYDLAFVEYERQVVAALQRVLGDAVMRRSTSVFDQPPAGVDFVLGFETGPSAFVCVHGGKRRLPTFALAPMLRYASAMPVLLVLRAGLTHEAEAMLRGARNLLVVRWSGPPDDEALAAAVEVLRHTTE